MMQSLKLALLGSTCTATFWPFSTCCQEATDQLSQAASSEIEIVVDEPHHLAETAQPDSLVSVAEMVEPREPVAPARRPVDWSPIRIRRYSLDVPANVVQSLNEELNAFRRTGAAPIAHDDSSGYVPRIFPNTESSQQRLPRVETSPRGQANTVVQHTEQPVEEAYPLINLPTFMTVEELQRKMGSGFETFTVEQSRVDSIREALGFGSNDEKSTALRKLIRCYNKIDLATSAIAHRRIYAQLALRTRSLLQDTFKINGLLKKYMNSFNEAFPEESLTFVDVERRYQDLLNKKLLNKKDTRVAQIFFRIIYVSKLELTCRRIDYLKDAIETGVESLSGLRDIPGENSPWFSSSVKKEIMYCRLIKFALMQFLKDIKIDSRHVWRYYRMQEEDYDQLSWVHRVRNSINTGFTDLKEIDNLSVCPGFSDGTDYGLILYAKRFLWETQEYMNKIMEPRESFLSDLGSIVRMRAAYDRQNFNGQTASSAAAFVASAVLEDTALALPYIQPAVYFDSVYWTFFDNYVAEQRLAADRMVAYLSAKDLRRKINSLMLDLTDGIAEIDAVKRGQKNIRVRVERTAMSAEENRKIAENKGKYLKLKPYAQVALRTMQLEDLKEALKTSKKASAVGPINIPTIDIPAEFIEIFVEEFAKKIHDFAVWYLERSFYIAAELPFEPNTGRQSRQYIHKHLREATLPEYLVDQQ